MYPGRVVSLEGLRRLVFRRCPSSHQHQKLISPAPSSHLISTKNSSHQHQVSSHQHQGETPRLRYTAKPRFTSPAPSRLDFQSRPALTSFWSTCPSSRSASKRASSVKT